MNTENTVTLTTLNDVQIDTEQIITGPKKRGRKPKNKTNTETLGETIINPTKPPLKKRGRKPKNQINSDIVSVSKPNTYKKKKEISPQY